MTTATMECPSCQAVGVEEREAAFAQLQVALSKGNRKDIEAACKVLGIKPALAEAAYADASDLQELANELPKLEQAAVELNGRFNNLGHEMVQIQWERRELFAQRCAAMTAYATAKGQVDQQRDVPLTYLKGLCKLPIQCPDRIGTRGPGPRLREVMENAGMTTYPLHRLAKL